MKSLSVDFSFSVDEVGGDVNHVQNVVNTFVPSLKQESFIFDGSKIDCVIDSVNSASDKFEIVKFAEFLFGVSLIDSNELADSGEGQSAIVLGDDSEIVLDEHSVELLTVGLS